MTPDKWSEGIHDSLSIPSHQLQNRTLQAPPVHLHDHNRYRKILSGAGYSIDDDDKWYKAKLQFITLDEKTEKEKRSTVNYLVQAKSLARALRYVDEEMGKTMIDYDTIGLNETNLMDVFEHQAPNKEEKNDVPEYEQGNAEQPAE